ncbi:MAG: hypothetical protein MK193_13460 [Lentisphaeria bacterium]|nr:hypothetical protein [Lentisphaeria bacterium]
MLNKLYPVLLILSITFTNAQESVKHATFGELKLIERIDCTTAGEFFQDFPTGSSEIATILDRDCRVLKPVLDKPSYFAYKLGKGKDLKPGAAYVLKIEYPEDVSRSMYVHNWGNQTNRGFATGQALGDALKGRYVNHNPESIQYPMSGEIAQWESLFYLHDRSHGIKRTRGNGEFTESIPAEGFWVILGQVRGENAPVSAGVAAYSISLYEVVNEASLVMQVNYPPEDLPRRSLFWREEMSDGVVAVPHKKKDDVPSYRGVKNPVTWYENKVKMAQFLGMNTYCKDLLEFGHNQGWDSTKYGSSNWVNQSPTPQLWSQILDMVAKYDMAVLPYYEYRGSIGQNKKISLGVQKRSERLDGGKTYTHVKWCENANANLLDPETFEDFKKILELTMTQYKDKINFTGAWLRTRPTHLPMSFNEEDVKQFNIFVNDIEEITIEQIREDEEILEQYYAWWFDQRKVFLTQIRDYLREHVNKDAVVMFTADSSEAGISLSLKGLSQKLRVKGWQVRGAVVTDDISGWNQYLPKEQSLKQFYWPVSFDTVTNENWYTKRIQKPWQGNWGKWDWKHSIPPADPENYQDADGVMMSYSYHRLYSVNDPKAFELYTAKSGLMAVRHYTLNENEMFGGGVDNITGYFVCDVERSGPHCMIKEARVMANGDPFYLGQLLGNSMARGYPEYVRNFNAAFLSLPALPSEVVKEAASDKEVVVRMIKTEKHGNYFAVINTSLDSKQDITFKLPVDGKVINTVTGEEIKVENGDVKLNMYSGQLIALLVR